MRILSLSCTNLNSLRGKQDTIYFDQGPLAAAGLFAITGPTGTGKTTLLDAITLALYGKVYRFEDDGAALKSEEVLNQLMTIGTGRCEVEVTFRAEGAVYHAKWACQRAYKKTEGAVQKAEMWLSQFDADGQLGSPYKTRSEVPREVARLTQLDFGQFVRSVLLPQGAFAQFLKAKKGGRAELLQKLTDTASFALIGLAAHQRCQQAERELDIAEQKALLFAGKLLPPEERLRLAHEAVEEAAQLDHCTQQQTTLRTALTWFDDDRKHREATTAAQQEAEASEVAASTPAAAELRRLLARHHQAEPCREVWDTWRRAVKHAQELTEHHQTIDQKTAALVAAVDVAKPAVATTETAWKTAHAHDQQQAPGLRQAEQLDRQAAAVDEQLTAQQARVAKAQKAHRAQHRQLVQERWNLRATRRQYKTVEEWLAAHAADAALTADALTAPRAAWRAYELASQQLQTLNERTTSDGQAGDKLVQHLDQNTIDQRDAKTAQQKAQTATETAHTELTTLLAQLGGHGAWLKAEHAAALLILNQLRRSHRLLEALQVLPAYRSTVVAGEPCPLCGAHEHQLAHVLTASDAEVAASERTLTAHETATNTLGLRVEAARNVFQQAKPLWPAATAWPPTALEPAAYFSAPAEAGLPQQITSLQKRFAAADLARQKAETQLEALIKAADALRAQQHELEQQQQGRTAERAEWANQCLAAQAIVSAFFAQVGQAFAVATVAAVFESLRQRGETYQQHQRDQQAALDRGTLLNKSVRTLTTAVADARQALGDEQQLVADHTRDAAALRAERYLLCPAHQQPATELMRLAEAEKTALHTFETARNALHAAEKAHSDHLIAVQLAEEQVLKAAQARDECRAHWHTQRAVHQFDEDADLDTWLVRDATCFKTHSNELADLDRRCEAAQNAVQRAVDTYRHHRTAGPSYASAAAAQADLDELTATTQQLLMAQGERTGLLRQHAEAATASLENTTAFGHQQTETARWQELKKLIGGADLKSTRFSQFAQSLTLAHLVGEANRHLQRLAPRYELLPKTDDDELGLWVLDADHAGTARAVESLSGGETFLVSLALALGLSDLAGYRVQIESLFIDEGFGTLDPETLDTAISALEVVQQSGRMIGVISHVAALKERIKTQIQLRRVAGGSKLAVVVEN